MTSKIKYTIVAISTLLVLAISGFLLWKYYYYPKQQRKELDEIRDRVFMNSAIPFIGNPEGHYIIGDPPVDTTFSVQIGNNIPESVIHLNVFEDTTVEDRPAIVHIDYHFKGDTFNIKSFGDTLYQGIGYEVYVLDFNFDGFRDIAYMNSDNHSYYHFWFYDSLKNEFIFSDEYSDMITGSWYIDPDKKEISIGGGTINSSSETIFGIINGHLTVTEQVSTTKNIIINDTLRTVTTKSKLIDGEMKEVEKTFD